MPGTRNPFRPLTVLDWRPATRDTPGAVFTGSTYTAPPFGPGEVLIAAAGVTLRPGPKPPSRPPWSPWWAREPGLVFRGTSTGIEVGAL